MIYVPGINAVINPSTSTCNIAILVSTICTLKHFWNYGAILHFIRRRHYPKIILMQIGNSMET